MSFNILGHQQVVSFFDRAHEAGLLHHAYCFVGPDQVGKRTVAWALAAQFLKISFEQVDACPDFFYLERLVDEKTEKRKKEISIEQARVLKNKLQTTSWLGGSRIVVIDGVEFLTKEAGNALLKLLEEPPARVMFFLLTTHESLVLSTIRSRVEVIHFELLKNSELERGLIDRGVLPSKAQELVAYAWGRPGRVLHLLHNPDLFEKNQEQVRKIETLDNAPLYEQFKILEQLSGGKKEESIGRDELDSILELWIMSWRKKLLIERNALAVFSLTALQEARQLLRANTNPRLVLENILLEIQNKTL